MGASRIVYILIVVLASLLKNAVAKSAGKTKKTDANQSDHAPTEKAAPVKSVSEQKREQAQRVEQWRAAKKQQDDARQLHSIKMDTCESRLENIRILYDAGILDRDEYVQRVERVKKLHSQQ